MNEKIKLLAEQAEQYADDTFNSDPAKYDTPEQEKVWCEMMQEKFAELIVAECAGLWWEIVWSLEHPGRTVVSFNQWHGMVWDKLTKVNA